MKCTAIKKIMLLGGVISVSNAMEYKRPHYVQRQHRSWPDVRYETVKALQEDLEKQDRQLREAKEYNNQARLLYINMKHLLKLFFTNNEETRKEVAELKMLLRDKNTLGSISPHVPKKNGAGTCHSRNGSFEGYFDFKITARGIEDFENDADCSSDDEQCRNDQKDGTVVVTTHLNDDETDVIDLSKLE